ncbi:MAG: DUF4276 family protein [Muribaculaceae bacterium]|nr:DUF4276 family protein [Muribaculaceae bacterium]MDE5957499.1 DUF4276 family protein [Muribaculaceae bacterium]
MKVAVYVEGQTELIFVREFLLKWFIYDSSEIGFECYELRDANPNETEYRFGSRESQRFYTIVNVGCDARALSKALATAPRHINQGYDKVIVLRDMYSDQYKSVNPDRTVSQRLNTMFIEGAQKSINSKTLQGYVYCQFAIMEIEAWLLGMGWYLTKTDSRLTQNYLKDNLKFNMDTDPETTIYHPAQRLKEIYRSVHMDYDKHSQEVNSIMSHLDKQDFELLLELDRCASFNSFVNQLIG